MEEKKMVEEKQDFGVKLHPNKTYITQVSFFKKPHKCSQLPRVSERFIQLRY